MKKILLILSIVLCAFSAQAKINVVATLPDLGSLAREIGGDNVSVTVLAKPTEDPHFVDARPSFVVALAERGCADRWRRRAGAGMVAAALTKCAQPEDRDRQTGPRAGVARSSLNERAGECDACRW